MGAEGKHNTEAQPTHPPTQPPTCTSRLPPCPLTAGANSKYNCDAAQCGTPAQPFALKDCPKELRSKDGTLCLSVCQAVVQKTTQNPDFLKNFDRALVCCECACGPNCGCDDGKNAACKYGCSPDHATYPPYNYEWKGVCDVTKWPKTSKGGSYTSVFKRQCPDAYSWQFDDQASTYRCRRADYTVAFY